MSLAGVLLTATASIALPDCPTDQTKHYHNCEGIFVWSNGDQYVGEWMGNKENGRGVFTVGDRGDQGKFAGDKYVGEFKDGKRHGKGTYQHASGNKYVGEYKDGKRHGKGTYTWADGDKYVGEFRNGKSHGQGTYTFSDGQREIGEYKNGKLNGYAIQYRADGSVAREGIFKDDKFLYASKNPNKSSLSNQTSKVEKSKSTCAEIGFTPGTQDFGKCVLKMMDIE